MGASGAAAKLFAFDTAAKVTTDAVLSSAAPAT